MAYEKQTWATGDTITAAKLNHMEDGIVSSGTNYDLVLTENFTENDPVMTGYGLSFDEIMTKISNGDDVSIKYIKITTGQFFVANIVSYMYDFVPGGDHAILALYGSLTGVTMDNILYYSKGMNVGIDDSLSTGGNVFYTFTYDSTTKEYAFTFDHYYSD